MADATPKPYDVVGPGRRTGWVRGGDPVRTERGARAAVGAPGSVRFQAGRDHRSIRAPSVAALNLQDRFPGEDSLTLAGRLTAWDDLVPAETAGMYNPRGHGILVDRAEIEDWLIREAAASGVTVMRGFTALRATRTRTIWSIDWAANDGPARAAASLLLEATGRGSAFGAGRRRRLDRMVALMAYGPAPPGTHDQRLIIEATEDGWWYGALLPGRRVVLAFLTEARDLLAGPVARRMQWRARLAATNHLRDLVAGVDLGQQPIRGFPPRAGSGKQCPGLAGWRSARQRQPTTPCPDWASPPLSQRERRSRVSSSRRDLVRCDCPLY